MVCADAASSERFIADLSVFVAVTPDSMRHPKTGWHQEPGASLSVRPAAFQGHMLGDLEQACLGLVPVTTKCLTLMILKGVVEIGEDEGAIGAAFRAMIE